MSIWGGSANTEPLPCGVRSDDFEDGNTSKKVYGSDDNYDDHDDDGKIRVRNQSKSDGTDGTEDEHYENNIPPRKNCLLYLN